MALDTATKRASAIGVGQPPGVILPVPDGTIDSGDRAQLAGGYAAGADAPPASTLAVYPRWLPLILAEALCWLRRYSGLRAAAITEAGGAATWAKYGSFRNVKVDVHSVPGYPRPNWPVPGA